LGNRPAAAELRGARKIDSVRARGRQFGQNIHGPEGKAEGCGMARVKDHKDFWSGMPFMAFGCAELWFGRDFPVGTLSRMGPRIHKTRDVAFLED
jgi:hypothetical protein